MSAFVMALAAGMAVGNGTERVSGEAEQPLDLRGEWKGEIWDNKGPVPASANSAGLTMALWWGDAKHAWKLTEEGDGRGVRIEIWGKCHAGIYRQEGDRLTICFQEAVFGRPTAFCPDVGQNLLILRHVKPDK